MVPHPFAPSTNEVASGAIVSQRTPGFVLAIWLVYIVTSPMYVLPSGGPQPADLALIVAALPFLALIFINNGGKLNITLVIGFLFAGWAFTINIANYLFFPDISFLKKSLMYGYNMVVFSFVVCIFTRIPDRARYYSFIAIIITIIYQIIFVTFFWDPTYPRATGSFSNPNQLGYWSILSGIMLILLRRNYHIGLLHLLALLALSYIVFFTQSKAAIFSFVILWFVILTALPLTFYLRCALLTFTVVLSVFAFLNPNLFINAYTSFIQSSKNIQTVIKDIRATGQKKGESLEDRGYYRILQKPHYAILGAGEGGYARFDKDKPNELHSGWATLVLSYGMLGTITLGAFGLRLIYRQKWFYIALMTPIVFYGFTHQNLRFTHFWVVLALLYVTPLLESCRAQYAFQRRSSTS